MIVEICEMFWMYFSLKTNCFAWVLDQVFVKSKTNIFARYCEGATHPAIYHSVYKEGCQDGNIDDIYHLFVNRVNR